MKEYSGLGSYTEDVTLKYVGKSVRKNQNGYHSWIYITVNKVVDVELLQNCYCAQRDIKTKLKRRGFLRVALPAGSGKNTVHQGSPVNAISQQEGACVWIKGSSCHSRTTTIRSGSCMKPTGRKRTRRGLRYVGFFVFFFVGLTHYFGRRGSAGWGVVGNRTMTIRYGSCGRQTRRWPPYVGYRGGGQYREWAHPCGRRGSAWGEGAVRVRVRGRDGLGGGASWTVSGAGMGGGLSREGEGGLQFL